MLERILRFSLRQRWLVLMATLGVAGLGAYNYGRLPIDAVPDITNRQVAINAVAPAFSPTEMEKQVTFPIETAMAGIPGLDYTRSFSRNGFAQVTAVFHDSVDLYFARQQVGQGRPPAAGPEDSDRRHCGGATASERRCRPKRFSVPCSSRRMFARCFQMMNAAIATSNSTVTSERRAG